MKKAIKIVLSLVGVTAILFLVKREKRIIKDLRKDLYDLH